MRSAIKRRVDLENDIKYLQDRIEKQANYYVRTRKRLQNRINKLKTDLRRLKE